MIKIVVPTGRPKPRRRRETVVPCAIPKKKKKKVVIRPVGKTPKKQFPPPEVLPAKTRSGASPKQRLQRRAVKNTLGEVIFTGTDKEWQKWAQRRVRSGEYERDQHRIWHINNAG